VPQKPDPDGGRVLRDPLAILFHPHRLMPDNAERDCLRKNVEIVLMAELHAAG
jgi:hypothetical protein